MTIEHDLSFEFGRTGVGTSISFISMLLQSERPFTLYVNEKNSIAEKFKSMFSIPDEKMTVVYRETLTNDISGATAQEKLSDRCKLFARYYRVDDLTVYGTTYQLRERYKPCIAIACYNTSEQIISSKTWSSVPDGFPYNRYYPIEYYSRIFELAKRAGYDVITMDNARIDFEQKAFIISNMCDCVIGYEGGLSHLANILRVPSIVLPWRQDSHLIYEYQNADMHTDYLAMQSQILHIDRRSYFPKNVSEVMNWEPEKFCDVIEDLHCLRGNNMLFSKYYGDVQISGDFSTVKFANNFELKTHWSKVECDFFRENIDKFNFLDKSVRVVDEFEDSGPNQGIFDGYL